MKIHITKLLIIIIAVEAKVRTLLNAEIQSEITSDFLLTRSSILRLLYHILRLNPIRHQKCFCSIFVV